MDRLQEEIEKGRQWNQLLELELTNLRAIRSQQRVDMPLTVAEAQRLRVCRICKLNNNPGPGNPLVLHYGDEYAHEQCLKRHIDKVSDAPH